MEVIQAKSAGFCFGVARAVKMARELAEADPRPRMLGSVIHNRRVMEELAASWNGGVPGSWTPPVLRWPTCSAWWKRRSGRAASR